MPQPLELSQLNIADSEILALIEACSGARPLSFSDGEYLFKEHEASRQIYLILKGAFNVEQSGNSDRALPANTIASHWNEVNEPCFVGEMAYFANGNRSASVRSSGSTYALELQPHHLEVILERFPYFTRILCRQFTQRLEEANEKLTELTGQDALNVEHLDIDSGETVILQGEPAEKLYLLIYGELEWLKDGQPTRECSMQGFIEPTAFLTDTPYRHSVRTRSASCLAVISNTTRQAVVRNYPDLLLGLLSETGNGD